MEQFEQILLKYKCQKSTLIPKTSISEIESLVRFNLPKDYNIFLQNYVGFEGFVGPQYFRLWSIDELKEFNNGYGIVDNLPKTLGIGTNGSGEFIGIEVTDKEKFRIILSPFIDLDKQYHIVIGTSFTDFLVRLENGLEWFES